MRRVAGPTSSNTFWPGPGWARAAGAAVAVAPGGVPLGKIDGGKRSAFGRREDRRCSSSSFCFGAERQVDEPVFHLAIEHRLGLHSAPLTRCRAAAASARPRSTRGCARISARRCFHCSAVATLLPSFRSADRASRYGPADPSRRAAPSSTYESAAPGSRGDWARRPLAPATSRCQPTARVPRRTSIRLGLSTRFRDSTSRFGGPRAVS